MRFLLCKGNGALTDGDVLVDDAAYVDGVALLVAEEEEVGGVGRMLFVDADETVGLGGYALVNALGA